MFQREASRTLQRRLQEPRRFIQIVTGPRQTGKTTAIKQAVTQGELPYRFVSADNRPVADAAWVEMEWRQARELARQQGSAVIILDEVQKVRNWAEVVKRLWDEDSWNDVPLKLVLSGSSSLLIQKGSSESLAGRYELLRSTHWSLPEMEEAFGYTLDDFLFYGGYPGAAALRDNEERWLDYLRDSIIQATLSKDILQLEDVRKPALLQALFLLGAQYSGQEMSYRKLLGQLDDKGNTETIAHYLGLLAGAGMMTGLRKYDAKPLNRRSSSPRLMLYDTALLSATWEGDPISLRHDPAVRGHVVETAVGARLIALSMESDLEVFWWRDGSLEVDFVVTARGKLFAIEVKGGQVRSTRGLEEFCRRYPDAVPVVVGDANLSLDGFLRGEFSF